MNPGAEKDELGAKYLETSIESRDAQSEWRQDVLSQFTPAEEKSIIRRIDLRLVSMTGLMYCISLLDRSNLANANIAGMDEDLELTVGARYSIITCLFFVTYIFFQFPATIAIRKIGPRTFLSGITFAWGVVIIGFGFVKEWTPLIGLRMLLGLLEAGFFPGCVYLLSTWYRRYEMAKRYAVFYVIGCFSSGLGGLLAYGIIQMDGLANLAGWRWIFIIEGIITVVVAGLGLLFLISFPDNKGHRSLRFLKPAELAWIVARLDQDRSDAITEKFQWKKWARGGTDWKVWAYAVIFGSITTNTYALSYFAPVILRDELGFDTGTAQCLIAPPYALAGITMYAVSYLSDKYKARRLALTGTSLIAITGLAVLGFVPDYRVKYFGLFLATAGSNAGVPISMTYQANNIRGQWKRAFCSASFVGMGGVGGIVGSTVFRQQDAPRYIPGLVVAMCANLLVVTLVVVLSLEFRRKNDLADRGLVVIEDGEKDFRYTY